jgi:aspartate aminotransferase
VSSTPNISPARLATRLERVGFSDIVKLRNRVMEMRAAGQTVHQFEGGEPFFPTPEHIKDAMTAALSANKTGYAPSSGIPELRHAITEKLRTQNNIEAQDEDVIVTNGGMQALYAAFQSLVNPGDEVLMFSPYWTPIGDLITGCEATPVFVPTDEARREGFRETLARYVTPKTRVIYYNTPQNPTGIVLSRTEAQAVASFAIERDLLCIADEAYEDLLYDAEHVSIAALPGMYERTVTTYTLSKSYAMTGWRLGYALAPEPWMTGLKKITLYSTNGVSTPTQWAALAALATPPAFFERIRIEYRTRRDLLVGGLNEIGLRCDAPAGAFYVFPDVTSINADSRQAANALLERAQIAAVPGVVFGANGEGHVRMTFSTSIEKIEAGLDSLRRNL